MSHEHELLAKLRVYKRRVFVLLGIGILLFPYSIWRIYGGHTQTGLITLLPSILGLAMGSNYLRVIVRHEKVLREIIAEEGLSAEKLTTTAEANLENRVMKETQEASAQEVLTQEVSAEEIAVTE